MSGPLVHSNGTAAAPAVTFTGDKTTGAYLSSAGVGALSASGTQVLTWTNGTVALASGIVLSAPGFALPSTINGVNGFFSSVVGTTATGALVTPSGTTGQEPGSPVAGMVRWNTSRSVEEVYDGTDWTSMSQLNAIEYVIDGGGSAIQSGVKGYLEIPYGFKIIRNTLMADVSGSIQVDVWSQTFGSFPPLAAQSITASAIPTLSSQQSKQDTTLTGWTTSIPAGNILAFNVVSNATSITRCTLSLVGKKQ